MIHTIEFWLPFPPSTNRLWRSVRGRVIRTPEYDAWKREALSSLSIQDAAKGPTFGPYKLESYLSSAFNNRGDADNRLKAIHDILVDAFLIVDDKHCLKTSSEWATIDHECLVKLTGEVAYASQWEFAQAKAEQQAERARIRQRQADRKSRSLRGLRLPIGKI